MNRQFFEQQLGEGKRPFEAFKTYLEMGPGRSLEAVAKKLSTTSTTLKQWSARWRWQERLEAWQVHVATRDQQALNDQAQPEPVDWEARRKQSQEENLRMARLMRKRGKSMLASRSSADRADAAEMLRVAAKLEAHAIGLPNHPVEIRLVEGGVVARSAAGCVIIYPNTESPRRRSPAEK